jgi:formiminoglutamase
MAQLAVLGAPVHRASISATNAHRTPAALRDALARFATWDGDHGVELADLQALDRGDVEGDDGDTDSSEAHRRIQAGVTRAFSRAPVVVVIGGDNSLTRPAMSGAGVAVGGDNSLTRPDMSGAAVGDGGATGLAEGWGLLTIDAHHDCRPLEGGVSNGNPVRGLIADGLPGKRVAQVGINGFANHADHAEWAQAQGIHVYRAEDVRRHGMRLTIERALADLDAAGATRIYADVDIDVADRAFAPACPASMPGGLRPPDLLEAAYLLGAEPAVRAVDFVEVDVDADVNGMTLRLMAAAFLSFCSGLGERTRP